MDGFSDMINKDQMEKRYITVYYVTFKTSQIDLYNSKLCMCYMYKI